MKKKQNKKITTKTAPLDDYEKELEDFLNRGDYVSDSPRKFEKTKKMFQKSAEEHQGLKHNELSSIPIKQDDLILLKEKAKKKKTPYQTLLSSLIHQNTEK